MSKLFQCFAVKEWLTLVLVFCLVSFQVWLDLRLPEYMSEITQLVQSDQSEMSEILTAGGKMMGCAFGNLVVTVIVGFFTARMATKVAQRLRDRVFRKTMSFSMGDINNFSTGSLITRSTNDITQIQMFVAMGFMVLIRAPLTATFAVIKISGKNLVFTQITLVAVAVLVVVLATMIVLAMPKSKKIQSITDDLNTKVREHLVGIRVVRAYNAEDYQQKKFSTSNEEFASANTFVNRTTAVMSPFLMCLMSTLTMVIYWAGSVLINEAVGPEKLTIFSDMVVFTSYAMQIIMAFMMLTMVFMMLPRVLVALGRISEVLDFENSIHEGTVSIGKSSGNVPAVEFKNVNFAYPDGEEKVLTGVSFTVDRGETLAIIGSTGSGKSSIVNLLQRFYDINAGHIYIDGVEIRDYDQTVLRDKMGLVTQKAILFSGTVTDNLTTGTKKPLSKEGLEEAVRISQSEEFVGKIGLDGAISQGGSNLSGGQKQRISIARALYKRPEIYIFDDCFSALDYKTDRVLRGQLNKSTGDATKIMVAQRISTVKDADKILVLDKGRVVDIGTHEKLLENCQVYQEIAQSQLSKEELSQ